MKLLTIGAFARASQLTPKALRLFDELGLLRPAAVDPDSGYRLYDPEQLEHAQLVAQLRRIGMPLDQIRTVCCLEATDAAEAIAAYWQQVTTDTAERGQIRFDGAPGTKCADQEGSLRMRRRLLVVEVAGPASSPTSSPSSQGPVQDSSCGQTSSATVR